MAHAFDTGAVKAGRTLLRDAVVAQLAQLTTAEGLYLVAVVPLPAPFRDDQDAFGHMLLDIVAGRSPVVAVALGDSKAMSGGAGYGDEWYEEVDVFAYCLSSHGASTLMRLTGDASSLASLAKDPGVEIAAEHVRERLAGWRPAVTGLLANELRPTTFEPDFYFGEDHTIARLTFTVQMRADVNRLRGFTQLLEGIDATHGEDDADAGAERPTLTTGTDIDP